MHSIIPLTLSILALSLPCAMKLESSRSMKEVETPNVFAMLSIVMLLYDSELIINLETGYKALLSFLL